MDPLCWGTGSSSDRKMWDPDWLQYLDTFRYVASEFPSLSCCWLDRWCRCLGTWQQNLGVLRWLHSCFLLLLLVGVLFFWGWQGVWYLRLWNSIIGHPLCPELALCLCHQVWCCHWRWTYIGPWRHSQFRNFCAVRYRVSWGHNGCILHKVLWYNFSSWSGTYACRNPIQYQCRKRFPFPIHCDLMVFMEDRGNVIGMFFDNVFFSEIIYN